jgi:cellobiose epimerase
MTQTANIQNILLHYKQEMQDELSAILYYWQQHTIDNIYGGFIGKINNENIADATAAKGVVLHARILWTFAAAYTFTNNKEHLAIAKRAFNYLISCFKDNEYGGVYWSVDYKGNMQESRKQLYGLAFTIYGMSECYAATTNEAALVFAKELYNTIEQYSFDIKNNGYFEAFARNWELLEDVRLSAKDPNASKTMNTHLHIIEAYANLYEVWKDEGLKEKIENLLFLFHHHFIDKKSGHLILFFDDV